TPFEVMVGAILTQNTAWANVEKAIVNLKRAKVLTPKALFAVPEKKLARLIKPSGFFNVKAKRLRIFLGYMKEHYGFSVAKMKARDLDELRKELLGVNGIGRETADSILLYALEKPTFVVDAYTKRILSRHGLCGKNDDYNVVKALFEDNLEQDTDLFNDFHAQIVNCAKDFCRTKPRCDACPLRVLFE
ncbi:MAG: endonuclease III domain-containing protein, partial [Candidatus Omnitrophica bacterium]|nr:endonuclease III domain-containing protein [Candidatus Omnitrophota bacterium]